MIYLDTKSIIVQSAQQKYVGSMSAILKKRIDRLDRMAARFFRANITSRLGEILGGSPEKIMEVNNEISTLIRGRSRRRIIKAITKVFDYKAFCDHRTKNYNAYDLAISLGAHTCTYCNRHYANTIIKDTGEKICRPFFDHYFDKGQHPLLALSFFNLIPCCSICNSSIKHTLQFKLDTHTHPYVEDVQNQFQFSYRFSSKAKDGLEVVLKSPAGSKVERTCEDMKLAIVYNTHTSELKDLLAIRHRFTDNYLSILSSNVLKGINLSKSELYRLAFGTELEPKDFHKRPLSKFKKDILTELGIVV